MLTLKEELTLRTENVPIIDLCNSSANIWFDAISLLDFTYSKFILRS